MSRPPSHPHIAGVPYAPTRQTTTIRAPGDAQPRRDTTTGARKIRGNRLPPTPVVSAMHQQESIPRQTGDRSKRSAYHNRGRAGPSPDTSHEPLALATVLWDWDGTIPNFRAIGPSVKEGAKVYICCVVDDNWYRVLHQDSCRYIPRAYVHVEGVYEKRFQSQFRIRANQNQIIGRSTTPAPPPSPKQGFFNLCCGYNPPHQAKPNRDPRPDISSLPLPNNHYIVDSQESQTKVAFDRTEPKPQGNGSGPQSGDACCSKVSPSWAKIRRLVPWLKMKTAEHKEKDQYSL